MKSKIINAPLFPNQDSGREILKHNEYPVFMTDEFDFLDVCNLILIYMESLFIF